MKTEWLLADVTAVGSIDRAERAILGVFMTGPVFGQSSADPPPRPTPTLGLSIKIITDVFPPIHSAMCDPKRSISPVDFHHHQRPSRSSWQFAAICGNLRQFAAICGDSRRFAAIRGEGINSMAGGSCRKKITIVKCAPLHCYRKCFFH